MYALEKKYLEMLAHKYMGHPEKRSVGIIGCQYLDRVGNTCAIGSIIDFASSDLEFSNFESPLQQERWHKIKDKVVLDPEYRGINQIALYVGMFWHDSIAPDLLTDPYKMRQHVFIANNMPASITKTYKTSGAIWKMLFNHIMSVATEIQIAQEINDSN